MTTTAKPPDPLVRVVRFQRRHHDQVLRIERASFEDPWGARHFARAASTPEVSMYVAERHQEVLGHIVLRQWPRCIEIWTLAVLPEARKQGIGELLVGLAKARLHAEACELVRVEVRETNLDAQLFFRAIGFRANGMPSCPEIADPAITFEFHLGIDGLDVLRNVLEGDGRRLDS